MDVGAGWIEDTRLRRGRRRVAVAFAAAASVVALAVLEGLPPRFFVATHFHAQFITVPVGLAVVSGILALRTYAYGGSRRTFAYGFGFVAFAAIYLWHGVFTSLETPFAFLAYGPLARIALAAALLFGLSNHIDPREVRGARIGFGLAGCLLLGGLAFAAHPLLAAFAEGASTATVHVVRIGLEGLALLLSVLAVVPLLRRTNVPVTPLIPFGLALNGGQSLLFLAAAAWDWTWWAAHGLGGLALGVLAWAVIVVERDELRAREAIRWKEIAELQSGFINAAAHQLKTPLTPVLLTVRSMETKSEGYPDLHRQVLLLERNLKRLSETVGELVEASLLADDAKRPREAVELGQAVRAACAQLAVERGTGCHLESLPSLVFVSAHPRILRYLLVAMLRAPTQAATPILEVDEGFAAVRVPRGEDETEENKLRLHLARSMAGREGYTLDLQDPHWIQLRMPLLVQARRVTEAGGVAA